MKKRPSTVEDFTGDNMPTLTFRIEPDVRAKFKSICALQNISIQNALRDYVLHVVEKGKVK